MLHVRYFADLPAEESPADPAGWAGFTQADARIVVGARPVELWVSTEVRQLRLSRERDGLRRTLPLAGNAALDFDLDAVLAGDE